MKNSTKKKQLLNAKTAFLVEEQKINSTEPKEIFRDFWRVRLPCFFSWRTWTKNNSTEPKKISVIPDAYEYRAFLAEEHGQIIIPRNLKKFSVISDADDHRAFYSLIYWLLWYFRFRTFKFHIITLLIYYKAF